MSEEQFITFRVPKKYIGDDFETHDEIKLPYSQGKSLKYYYLDTRFTLHLNQKNTTHHVRKKDTRQNLRTSYIPQPGEIFVFVPAGRAMS